jgi:hypothetical protein
MDYCGANKKNAILEKSKGAAIETAAQSVN